MNTKTNDLPESVIEMIEEGKPCWYRDGGIEYLAFLLSKITYTETDTALYISVINSRRSLVVKPETCRPIKDGEVRAGFIGIVCHHQDFGMGVIMAEEFIEGSLFITMVMTGKNPFKTRLNDVILCCFSNK